MHSMQPSLPRLKQKVCFLRIHIIGAGDLAQW
ncbi:rCG52985 [Rattus norvegicus]|uniref:RCG52985 n=1 Tax=Rattus norvegicus TaxID=10116 RepID=A6IRW1_RAT|nr:rCG52985 [Rattus norvegicus]